MTISATGNRESYAGNGVTTVFAFPHPFFANTDLVVQEQVVSTGIGTTLVLNTDYTVSGANTQTGGSVTRTVATATGTNIVIVRAVPYTQGSSFPNNTAFDGPTVEAAFDRAVVLCAQVLDSQSRSPTLGTADIDGSGSYNAKLNKITNLTAGVAATDAISKSQLDAAVLNAAGFTVSAGTISTAPAGTNTEANVQATLTGIDTRKAPLASPVLTGTPTLPTGTIAVTQTVGDSSTKVATTAFATTTLSTSGPPLVATLIPYYIAGMLIANNGAASMDIQTGVCTDGNNTHILTNPGTFTKTQAAFAGGTGNGGKMSAAAMVANTWYYFWALRKDTDGSFDVGFDASPTAPTAQAGYTAANYRYIGARKTQAAATNWDTFVQHGDEVFWSTPPALDVNTVNPGIAAVSAVLNVPTGRKMKAYFRWQLQNFNAVGGALAEVLFSELALTDLADSLSASPLSSAITQPSATTGYASGDHPGLWTDISSQIRYRLGNSNASIQMYIVATGWLDPRGKPV